MHINDAAAESKLGHTDSEAMENPGGNATETDFSDQRSMPQIVGEMPGESGFLVTRPLLYFMNYFIELNQKLRTKATSDWWKLT